MCEDGRGQHMPVAPPLPPGDQPGAIGRSLPRAHTASAAPCHCYQQGTIAGWHCRARSLNP